MIIQHSRKSKCSQKNMKVLESDSVGADALYASPHADGGDITEYQVNIGINIQDAVDLAQGIHSTGQDLVGSLPHPDVSIMRLLCVPTIRTGDSTCL